LVELSLLKPRHTLALFDLFEERREDIVQFSQHFYASTPEQRQTKDRLRALVIRYVACVVEMLEGSKEFLSMLSDINSISFDLMVELWKRLD
jgi:hypothetical protein